MVKKTKLIITMWFWLCTSIIYVIPEFVVVLFRQTTILLIDVVKLFVEFSCKKNMVLTNCLTCNVQLPYVILSLSG